MLNCEENCGVAHRSGSQQTATDTAESGGFQLEETLIEEPWEQ